MMRYLAPALARSFSGACIVFSLILVAGCQSDTFVKNNLPAVCAGVEATHAAFVEIATSFTLKPSTVTLEASAHDDAVKLCNNPGADTAATAVTVAGIGVRIGLALMDARHAKAAKSGG